MNFLIYLIKILKKNKTFQLIFIFFFIIVFLLISLKLITNVNPFVYFNF